MSTPLNPTLYSKTGVYRGILYFLISMFLAGIKKISEFLSENFQFLVVKFSIYLNRLVFVMRPSDRNK